jgi:hypothetical protein
VENPTGGVEDAKLGALMGLAVELAAGHGASLEPPPNVLRCAAHSGPAVARLKLLGQRSYSVVSKREGLEPPVQRNAIHVIDTTTHAEEQGCSPMADGNRH